jgi:hypothetical protein
MALQVEFSFTPLPEGFCPANQQEAWTGMQQTISGSIPGDLTVWNYGFFSGGVPDPADQDKPWFRLNGDLSPDGDYSFFNGVWAKAHWLQQDATANIITLYDGDATAIKTYDGGSDEAVTATSGPMWEIVAAWVDRIPKGAGVLALNANSAVIASAATLEARGVNFIRRTARTHYRFPQ